MNIYHGIETFEPLKYPVVTSGSFDGVHRGHQKILNKVTSIAREKGGESVLITFWPHPRQVLYPDDDSLKILTTFDEKADLLGKAGIDHLVSIPFTKEFSQISSEDFIRKYLVEKINTRMLVIGYDHRFGKNREGGFEHLKANSAQYGFHVEEIPPEDVDHVAVSSTKIRNALYLGNLDLANKYLGRRYSITGVVEPGKKIGRQLGFPTANIQVDDDKKLIPVDGIYAVLVAHEGVLFEGMLSIGVRPTIGVTERTIEANIFGFNRDIYGDRLTIHFVRKFRDEMKFNSLDELKRQLELDKETATQILASRQ